MEPCDDTNRLPVDALINSATKAKEVESDGQRVVKQSPKDVIAMDKYLALRQASCMGNGDAWGMVKKSRVVPPSAVGEERT